MKPKKLRGRRNKSVTIQKILDAAAYMFALNGFEATSLDMVAQHAQLARQTIYDNFKLKDQLLIETLSRLDQLVEGQLLCVVYHDCASYRDRLMDLRASAKLFFSNTGNCLFQRLIIEFKHKPNKFTKIIEEHLEKWRLALLHLYIPMYGEIEGRKRANKLYNKILTWSTVCPFIPPLFRKEEIEAISIQMQKDNRNESSDGSICK